MTVGELKKKLAEYDDDLGVVSLCEFDGHFEVARIEVWEPLGVVLVQGEEA